MASNAASHVVGGRSAPRRTNRVQSRPPEQVKGKIDARHVAVVVVAAAEDRPSAGGHVATYGPDSRPTGPNARPGVVVVATARGKRRTLRQPRERARAFSHNIKPCV